MFTLNRLRLGYTNVKEGYGVGLCDYVGDLYFIRRSHYTAVGQTVGRTVCATVAQCEHYATVGQTVCPTVA